MQKIDPKERSRKYVLPLQGSSEGNELQYVDLRKLTDEHRKLIVSQTLRTNDQDNEFFLTRLKERMDRVGIRPATVEVRFEDLQVDTKVYVGSRAMPSVIHAYQNVVEDFLQKLHILRNPRRKFVILDKISGIIPPGRITLLLGPPGSGKSTLLEALSNKLDLDHVRLQGKITFNGQTFSDFTPERSVSYVSQVDQHVGELTVRETFDFASRCQGVGHKEEELRELQRREAEQGLEPDWELQAFLKAESLQGKRSSISTEYVLRLLGLEICADTLVGNAMLRGISGGQKKRVTTGEMIVGPKKCLMMDEISTGLDSSTTFQIVRCIRNWVHLREATLLMALLQPAPEIWDLFDDIMFMSEGQVVYHGPREHVVPFFESLGFRCPERKGVADFLQEVTSQKDQQGW